MVAGISPEMRPVEGLQIEFNATDLLTEEVGEVTVVASQDLGFPTGVPTDLVTVAPERSAGLESDLQIYRGTLRPAATQALRELDLDPNFQRQIMTLFDSLAVAVGGDTVAIKSFWDALASGKLDPAQTTMSDSLLSLGPEVLEILYVGGVAALLATLSQDARRKLGLALATALATASVFVACGVKSAEVGPIATAVSPPGGVDATQATGIPVGEGISGTPTPDIPTPPANEQRVDPVENPLLSYFNNLRTGNVYDLNSIDGSGLPQETVNALTKNALSYIANVNRLNLDNPDINASNIRVYTNGLSGEFFRNTPVGFVLVGGRWHVYWLTNSVNNELSASPFYNTFGPDIPKETLYYIAVPLPKGATPDTVRGNWAGERFALGYVGGDGFEVLNLSASDETFTQLDMREVAKGSDPFQVETWPAYMQEIYYKYVDATPQERGIIKRFLDALREERNEKAGLTEYEELMRPYITPELFGVWQDILWVQMNRDAVIADGGSTLLPVILPDEMALILHEKPFARWEEYTVEGGKLVSANTYGFDDFTFGVSQSTGYPEYSSDVVGDIAGIPDFIVGRPPYTDAWGDVAAIFKLPEGSHYVALSQKTEGEIPKFRLFGGVIHLDKEFILQEGDIVFGAYRGELVIPFRIPNGGEVNLGVPIKPDGSAVTLQELLHLLGKNIHVKDYDKKPLWILLPDGRYYYIDDTLDKRGFFEQIGGVIAYSQEKYPEIEFPVVFPWNVVEWLNDSDK